jgi:hypothetical protein
MLQGIEPMVAVERLKRFREEYRMRERKYLLYQVGEEIFALASTDYPDLKVTEKELKLSDQLFGLYTDVLDTLAVSPVPRKVHCGAGSARGLIGSCACGSCRNGPTCRGRRSSPTWWR